MRGVKSVALLLFAVAVPATAQTFGFAVGASGPACLAIGNLSYRIAPPGTHGDFAIRIDPAAAAPDLRIQIVDAADEADFVFVDDGDGPPLCRQGSAVRTVRVDPEEPNPSLVVGLATTPGADYRIFVRSRFVAPEAAAALFAAARLPARALARANPSN